ncbi:PEP/pyruvate-binding domain-containing protein [candidate division KSB1 bacterium]|nr:PEP/pyruvate-binding domain-containing protein [candidate division KSB1 bacterium]
MKRATYIKWQDNVDQTHKSIVGAKFANLGELVSLGMNVPSGFCINTVAFFEFTRQSNLMDYISKTLESVNYNDRKVVKRNVEKITASILKQEINSHIKKAITRAYNRLRKNTKASHFAVRSSGVYEDLPDSSFAGQYDTYLGVSGIEDLLFSVKKCWASVWNERILYYRRSKNLDHSKVSMAVIVQPVIACLQSGVMFTVNPVSNKIDEIVINAGWGLGEVIVSQEVSADEYIVCKSSKNIKKKRIGDKNTESVLHQNR